MKNKTNNSSRINFENIFFLYPVYAGILYIISNKVSFCQVNKCGDINLLTFQEKKVISKNLFFLRGIEYVVNSFFLYIKYFIFSLKNYFKIKKIKNKNKKNNFLFILLIIFIIFLIFVMSWFLFWFLPAIIGFAIFPNSLNYFFKNFCVGIVKCAILWLLIFMLRIFANIKNILQINTAGNMATCNSERFNALNFFNVLVVTLLLDFFVISLIGLNTYWLIEFIFQLATFFICCGLSFEICIAEEMSKNFLKKIKILTCVLFYATPSKTDKQIAYCGYIEGERMKKDDYKYVNITANQDCYPIALVLSEVKSALQKAKIEDYGEAEWLVAYALGCKKFDLKILDSVNATQYGIIQDALKRRVNNEPLAKIFQETEFYGLKFFVNKKVLTPRQETEILVENIIKENQNKSNIDILDLCTGSGAIGIALAHNLKCAEILAVDVSEEALGVAQKNAELNNVKNIKFKQSDLFSFIKKHKKFDVIASNPPYIATDEIAKLDNEVKNFDPILALDGGVDGLYFYKKIAELAPIFLKENGRLFLEIGYSQGLKVKKLLTPHFENIKIIKDYAGLPRLVVATKKDK